MTLDEYDKLYLALAFPQQPDPALTRGELAEAVGVNLNWVSRNVPAYLFIGNRIHWFEYCHWRMKEQERRAKDAGHSQLVAREPVEQKTEADRRWKEIEDRFYGRRKD
jgi:hypothetical protein